MSPISKKVNVQNCCQIDILSNRTRVIAELRYLRFCKVNWQKNITTTMTINYYRKESICKNWFQIEFLPNRTRVKAKIRFAQFCLEIWKKKYYQYRKKLTVNLQNCCQIDFLFNRTRFVVELRFLRFCLVILLKNKISPISEKVNL